MLSSVFLPTFHPGFRTKCICHISAGSYCYFHSILSSVCWKLYQMETVARIQGGPKRGGGINPSFAVSNEDPGAGSRSLPGGVGGGVAQGSSISNQQRGSVLLSLSGGGGRGGGWATPWGFLKRSGFVPIWAHHETEHGRVHTDIDGAKDRQLWRWWLYSIMF